MYLARDSGHEGFDNPVWPEDLDLGAFFPRGARAISIKNAPGTSYRFKNEYLIFVSADLVSALPNLSLAKIFDQHWLGNVLVVKIGQRDRIRVVNMI